jgi:hypothetical protein
MNSTALSTAPPKQQRQALTTGAAVSALVPTSLSEVYRLAEAIGQSGMAPKTYGTDPAKISVGILAGMEIGLTPFAALQSIAIINGNPALWGDGALALALASGLVEDMAETDDGETATCMIKRVGRPTPITRAFSMADAAKAGLKGKAGPWTQYPARMRQMRARGFCLRDAVPDVLKGLQLVEERTDYHDLGGGVSVSSDARPRLTGAALIEQAEPEAVEVVDDDGVVTEDAPAPTSADSTKAEAWTETHIAAIESAPDAMDLGILEQQAANSLAKLKVAHPELLAKIDAAKAEKLASFSGEPSDETWRTNVLGAG